MLKNSDGKKSVSLTMMIVGFVIVSLWLLVSIVSKIGHIEIRPFSATDANLYLSPLILLYFGRRQTEAKATITTATSVAKDK